jgi:Flp pilus assembly protein CpaB
MTYRTRNILIAVALAGFAALLVTFYVSNYKSSVQHQSATVTVPVAAHDIAVNTPGSVVVANGWVTTREIPRNAVVPGAISSPAQIKSLVATQPTYAGEQITAERFGPIVQQGLPGQISGTQRAVQIAGDSNQTLAGTIQPGDHVDFEGVLDVSVGATTSFPFSRIVVRDLKVLSVQTSAVPNANGKLSGPGGSGGNSQTSVMLRMTDAQSQKILLIYAAARQSSTAFWSLELRPGLKSQDSPNSVETPFTVLTDGIAPTTLKAALGVAVIAAAAGGGH